MNSLKLETFLASDTDWEMNQYRVLAGIKEYSSEFNRKKLYPSLSELIALSNILEDVLKQKHNLKNSFPKHISNYDLKNKKIVFETIENITPDMEFMFDLIEWALPVLRSTIEEGIVIYEYVEKNLNIEQVGILPLYKNEGYFLVPDNNESILQVHRFECSLFSCGNEPFRSLKTNFVEAIEQYLIMHSPEAVKMHLVSTYKDLPNPATFICETDIDFPFTETLFPVAKRKLMSRVA